MNVSRNNAPSRDYFAPARSVVYCDESVCLSACLSVCSHIAKIFVLLPVVVARSFSVGIAI